MESPLIDKIFWIVVGITLSDLIYHLRFSNPYLRKEMLLIMSDSNEYFIGFFFIGMFAVIILGGLNYYLNYRKGKVGKNSINHVKRIASLTHN